MLSHWPHSQLALVGMPLMIAYTAYIYHIFRGTARVEDEGC